MTDTLRRLARLKQLEETEAQRALVEAQDAEARCRAETDALQDRLASLRSGASASAEDVAMRHSAALHLELSRRRQARHAAQLSQQTERRRAQLRAAMVETRKADRIVEVVEEREALEAAKADQARLDAAGTRGWFRRRAA